MSANPRLIFPPGPLAGDGARQSSSRQMLETAGRYFELPAEIIRRVLDDETSASITAPPAPATAIRPDRAASRRTGLPIDVHSRMLAAIRRVADGERGKEE